MPKPLLPDWHSVPRPVIGMLHAPPLPGSPGRSLDWEATRAAVLRDAEALVTGGVHGLMLENYGDTPFFPDRVPAETVACLTLLAADVRSRFPVPLGMNVLRNDGRSALAIAAAVGASFIRVNVLCGARVTDQGVIGGIAHDLLRDRARLGAASIRILADVNVKHSAPVAARPIADEVQDLIERGGADAVIVSGTATGKAADLAELVEVKQAAGDTPVFVGSGVSEETASRYLPQADGFVVGTSFKRDRRATNPVDAALVRALIQRLESHSTKSP